MSTREEQAKRCALAALQRNDGHGNAEIILQGIAEAYREALGEFFPGASPDAMDAAAREFEKLMRSEFAVLLSSHADDGALH